MKQTTLAVAGFEKHGRATRKAEFLSRMDALVPWAEFCALIDRTTLGRAMGVLRSA